MRRLPALAVALAVSAALGPPAAAASGGGGGAVAGGPAAGGPSGGGTYGQAAPKSKPKAKRRHRRVQPTSSVPAARHRFPLTGAYGWGGADARFGARRKGHRHQGQDLTAAAGTSVVAPYGGLVTVVRHQARGAGHFVVVRGADYDYVFMHLLRGSTVVREGQRVRAGQRIAAVGSTGGATGPHLHFELWLGAWAAGGHPIDPLPLLKQWSGLQG